MKEKNTIKQWSKDDRPREKLLVNGPQTLSSAELLAILIHNGTRSRTALELAQEVMKLGQDDLNNVGRLSIKDIMRVKGIGEAKAVTIAAALEIGRRRQAGTIDNTVINGSRVIAGYLQERFKDYLHEIFALIFLNHAGRVIGFEVLSEGGITATVVDVRLIFKKALEQNATSIIISHNHPSGSLKPSPQDEALTEKIIQAARLLDIQVQDHIIVSDRGYYSFADAGIL